jgi:hypothetical protein
MRAKGDDSAAGSVWQGPPRKKKGYLTPSLHRAAGRGRIDSWLSIRSQTAGGGSSCCTARSSDARRTASRMASGRSSGPAGCLGRLPGIVCCMRKLPGSSHWCDSWLSEQRPGRNPGRCHFPWSGRPILSSPPGQGIWSYCAYVLRRPQVQLSRGRLRCRRWRQRQARAAAGGGGKHIHGQATSRRFSCNRPAGPLLRVLLCRQRGQYCPPRPTRRGDRHPSGDRPISKDIRRVARRT